MSWVRVRRLKQKAKREDVKGGGGKRGMEGYVGNGFVREGTEVKDRRKDGERENARAASSRTICGVYALKNYQKVGLL